MILESQRRQNGKNEKKRKRKRGKTSDKNLYIGLEHILYQEEEGG